MGIGLDFSRSVQYFWFSSEIFRILGLVKEIYRNLIRSSNPSENFKQSPQFFSVYRDFWNSVKSFQRPAFYVRRECLESSVKVLNFLESFQKWARFFGSSKRFFYHRLDFLESDEIFGRTNQNTARFLKSCFQNQDFSKSAGFLWITHEFSEFSISSGLCPNVQSAYF